MRTCPRLQKPTETYSSKVSVKMIGHNNPTAHNEGNTSSIFTSWTTNPAVAARFASIGGPGGVVHFKNFNIRQVVPSPDRYSEHEILVIGPVTGATVRVLP